MCGLVCLASLPCALYVLDGGISFEEFELAMKNHPAGNFDLEKGKAINEETLRKQFAAIDQDDSGEIQYTEFLAAAMAEKVYTDNQLKAAFKRCVIPV